MKLKGKRVRSNEIQIESAFFQSIKRKGNVKQKMDNGQKRGAIKK